ncbi:hypothetical protein [Kribbella solani]|uniref:Uncharacterized protein n=1 Tax=Kribbella solani TaxID=236067 RepID=A0A841E2V8_9ACTN|nr:hypothetical protein [Kribbella solani]MBB5983376.1 hypothetical protein [Kribbella solani]
MMYLQEQGHVTHDEMDRAIERMREFAQFRSLEVTEIFVEQLEIQPYGIAYRAMLGQLRGRKERVLITPGVHHFSNLHDDPPVILEEIKNLGVMVLFPGHVE